MKKYVFYDTDLTGQAEYDIAGENYQLLIRCCFQHCHSVSVMVESNQISEMHILNELDKYRILTTPEAEAAYRGKYGHYWQKEVVPRNNNPLCEIRQYILCPEVEQIFLKVADSIFSWLCGWEFRNPTDPTFFREDGSIFFASVVHDGECRLFIRETENAESILAIKGWSRVE